MGGAQEVDLSKLTCGFPMTKANLLRLSPAVTATYSHFLTLLFFRPPRPLAFEWVVHSLFHSFSRQPLERGRV
jgi:hypothetical protein